MVRLAAPLFFLLAIQLAYSSTIVTDTELNYSIFLPENWVHRVVSPQHHRFYDTTGNYRSQINLIRHSFCNYDYPTSKDWTMVNFIAYELTVKNVHNPLGIFLYGDSSSSLIQPDSLQAAEIYARFCYLDESPLYWEEFVRFAATDTFGYEMYVLGDTLDMQNNVGFYAAIIQDIHLPGETMDQNTAIFSGRQTAPPFDRRQAAQVLFDLKGRKVPLRDNAGYEASGLYLPGQTAIANDRKIVIRGSSR